MARKISIHPVTPQQRLIFDAADALRAGQVCLIPTETQYALACRYSNKKGIERIRQLRNLDKSHTFTLLIDSMNGISRFAKVSDVNFKLIKRLIPGPYTFIMPSTKEVPRLLLHPRRKTIGFRVSSYPICEQIIAELGEPLLAVSARSSAEILTDTIHNRHELFEHYNNGVDLIIDDQFNGSTGHQAPAQTSVIDLTDETATIIREGTEIDKVLEVFSIMNFEVELEEEAF